MPKRQTAATTPRGGQRFIIPKLLAVSMIACGPAPAPKPVKTVAAACVADQFADGGCDLSCETPATCDGYEYETTTFPDGGPGCVCEPYAA